MTWVGETRDPVAAIVAKVRHLPDRERERLRRAELLDGSRLDFTHPPTSYRVEAIASRPFQPVKFVLGQGRSDAVDAELDQFRAPIGARIVGNYQTSIGG